MANSCIVKMSPKAVTDLDNIYSHISEELFAVSAATNILESIEKGIMRLKEFPRHLYCMDRLHLVGQFST